MSLNHDSRRRDDINNRTITIAHHHRIEVNVGDIAAAYFGFISDSIIAPACETAPPGKREFAPAANVSALMLRKSAAWLEQCKRPHHASMRPRDDAVLVVKTLV